MKRTTLLLALAACSCAKQRPLPTYPRVDAEQAAQIIQGRSDSIRTVQSRATIVLTDAKGESVSLDGALLMEKPDRLRVRAWKLGQAVFDLTVTPEGVWQYVPRDEAKGAMGITREVAQQMLALLTGNASLDGAEAKISFGSIEFSRDVRTGVSERYHYDRPTLMLQRYGISSTDGVARLTLDFVDHRVIGDHVWPMRIKATSQQGVVSIRFSDVEINTDLPAAAFKAPARAEQVR